MQITLGNMNEYIIASISLAGELDKNLLITNTITDNYYKDTLYRMSKDKLITRKEDRVRLLAPKGIDSLKKQEDLYTHYMLMTTNHRTPKNRSEKARRQKLAQTVSAFIRKGMYIDNIQILHITNEFGKYPTKAIDENISLDRFMGQSRIYNVGERNFLKDSARISYFDMITNLEPGNAYFYTSKVIKFFDESNINTVRIALSRTMGELLSNGNSYPIYYIKSLNEIWKKEIEKEVKFHIDKAHDLAFGKESLNRKRELHKGNQAIFLTDKKDLIEPICKMPLNTKNINPRTVFGEVYLLPNDEDGFYVMDLLLSENWEEKIIKSIYGKKVTSGLPDAMINQKPSWELLSCNVGKLKKITSLNNKQIHIVCYEWQKEILTKILFKKEIEFKILSNSNMEKLYKNITGKNYEK